MEKILFWRIVFTFTIVMFFINGVYRLIFSEGFIFFDFSILILSEFVALVLTWNIRLKSGFINKKNINTFVTPAVILMIFFLWCQINLAYILGLFMNEVNNRLIFVVFNYLNGGLILLLCLLLPKINFSKF